MNSLRLTILSCALGVLGCDGAICPAIYIPIYEVSVYDKNTDELLCWENLDFGISRKNCEIIVEYSKEDDSKATITVKLEGYQTQTLSNVANQSKAHQCFDNPEYTTKVDVLLMPVSL